MSRLFGRFAGSDDERDCGCDPAFEDERLVVDADGCPGAGRLATEPDCRRTVVEYLRERDAESITTVSAGMECAYEGPAAAFLVAAGRFAEAVAVHDADLAMRACVDPLGAARAATGRAGPVATLAAETGLTAGAARADGYRELLRPYVGPTVSRARIAARPPADASLVSVRDIDTGATVRVYDRSDSGTRRYHLEPVEHGLDPDATATLAAAYDRLASGAVDGGERAPGRAVRRVADGDSDVATLEAILGKHTTGYGVLTDLFADERVSDVFATAPTADNHLRVRYDGDLLTTNVRLTEQGVSALASRFRRESGRAFSRASPTLDATAEVGGRRLRVAGVSDPVSDGVGFAFRAHEREAWTLPALVENGTLPADAAALLSLAVERDAATLLAGTRGAGKTTLLGALLWELPATTRTVVIEDTPELPVEALQRADRDVQALRTDDGGGGVSPTAALRTALRLGEGALVLGEVRGEEASVLYEAMRVGASGSAVLGTIHGDGGAAVRERVVADLGVPASSFAATDLVVTCEPYETPDGRARRVKSIEEVVAGPDGPAFVPLYELADGALVATGEIARGNSRLAETLTRSAEAYNDVRKRLDARASWLASLADDGRTDTEGVCTAHARRRAGTA
ncbi:ATPase, T2SS/T4P/T4SS family [Halorientalis litorea]|uniref:ATPase, T2SS/T4P/T4SS family n=1 Tax=Halorientalis litorea TaxID=2931977 RepID=UPI001FF6F60C|nr:ATPase, T2SS/T4P/T4SS family [Halorientalis litorea]